jgi:hypothetical protein
MSPDLRSQTVTIDFSTQPMFATVRGVSCASPSRFTGSLRDALGHRHSLKTLT